MFSLKMEKIDIKIDEYPTCECGGVFIPFTNVVNVYYGRIELRWKCSKCIKVI